jgi:pimeloyl-ACP methyl ester carboxylesterase
MKIDRKTGAVLILGICALVAYWGTRGDRPESATVPNVVGMRLADARTRLDQVGLKVAEPVQEREGPGLKPGLVLEQMPRPEGDAELGAEVKLWVLSAKVTVPALSGMTRVAALAELGKHGLQAGPAPATSGAEVLGQQPPPGVQVARGTSVALQFRGPTPHAEGKDDAERGAPGPDDGPASDVPPSTTIGPEKIDEEMRKETGEGLPADARERLGEAEKAVQKKEYSRAIPLLEEAAGRSPPLWSLPAFLHDLAVVHLAAGNRDKAKHYLDKALGAGVRPPAPQPSLPAPPPRGMSDAEWKEEVQSFESDFEKKSIRFKWAAIEMLPTDDHRTIEFIIKRKKLLSHKDWRIRVTAAERLSKIEDPALRKKLHEYAKDPDKRIREGIVYALATSHDKLDPPVIVEALKDGAWEVRRMACWAAGQQRVREAVEPMISMIHEPDGLYEQQGESNRRVHCVLLFNLEEITGGHFHTDVLRWKLHWVRNRDRTLPPVKRFDVGSFADVTLQFNDTVARNGSGPLVIALPETHKSTVYYMPYFNQWTFVKWLFINLPPMRSFPDVEFNEHGDPIYPVDILVDAFEDMRKKRRVEKMILLGHGFSTWIAAKYAQKYPDRVQGLIFIETYASRETFSKLLDKAKRSGDPDAEFWAQVSTYEVKIGSRIEGEIYAWFRDTASLAPKNRGDMEVGILRRIWRDPNASSIQIPEFDIRSEEVSRIPCLMYFAHENNELTGYDDLNRLKRYYPRHVIVPGGDKFARLPFMEAPEEFEKALREFLRLVESR